MGASKSNGGVASLESDPVHALPRKTHLSRARSQLRRDYLTMAAIAIIAFLALMTLLAPVFSGLLNQTYQAQDLGNTFARASQTHWLGTDELGRDVFVRLLYAGRVSLSIAFAAAFLSLAIGIFIGVVSGYFGGVVDDLLIWFITTLNSIPSIFLLLIIYALFRPGPVELVLALGLLGWTGTMRLVRGETLALREREFIVAARAMGASSMRIMFLHIFPNLISIVVVSLAIDIGALILTEASLSFVGFGIQQPTPSWGNMLTNGQQYFGRQELLVWAPGVLITVTVLCMYIIGDGVRDALDPTIDR